MNYVGNFIASPVVKEFGRYVKFWPNYSYLARFLGHSIVLRCGLELQ